MNRSNIEETVIKLIGLFNEKKFEEIIDITLPLLKSYSNVSVLSNLLGASYAGIENHFLAIKYYNKAIKLEPNNFEIINNLGKSQIALESFDVAIRNFKKAIKINNKNYDAYFNLGIIFHKKNLLDQSIVNYNQAIKLQSNFAEAHYNLGLVFSDQGKNKDAIDSFQRTLNINNKHFKALNSLGIKYINLNKFDEAVLMLKKALYIKPNYPHALNNLGAAYLGKKEYLNALKYYSEAYDFDKKMLTAGIQKFYLKKRICDWSDIDELKIILDKSIDSNFEVPPWQCLAMEDNPKNHLIRAKNYSRKFKVINSNNNIYNNSKIRIGYFAADFHQHPGMVNMAGIFDHHDKKDFEIYGFYYGEIKRDHMHYRVKKNFDKFFYVDHLNDHEISNLSRENKIDIAIHRAGHTDKARSSIFGYRLAPIQINYLGYPGTTGQAGIDYIIGDKFVIPEGYERYYSEKIIYLTDCFYPKDNTRGISKKVFSRKDFEIPEDAFVFCSFNNTYKLSNDEFSIWMNILSKVKNTYLVLLTNNEEMKKNIFLEAKDRNVDNSKIKFFHYINYEDHLARHSIADLFLDSFNYNAHTSTVDSLWAGLPVLTKVGKSFSARICGSILNSLNFNELVSYDKIDYEKKAIEFATNSKKIFQIKSKLLKQKESGKFFDTQQYTRNLEKAYKSVHELRINHGKFESLHI